MDIDLWVWGALTVWVIGGLVGYYYMVRRAHPSLVWLLVGIGLGPFAVLVFMERADERPAPVSGGSRPEPGRRTEVVVGVDGSPEAAAAVAVANRLFAGDDCCVVLCEVIDYDSRADPSSTAASEAQQRLDRMTRDLDAAHADTQVVVGTPVESIVTVAEERQASLIVVGNRGKGLSRRLLGSVSEGLVERGPCPVLIVHDSSNDNA